MNKDKILGALSVVLLILLAVFVVGCQQEEERGAPVYTGSFRAPDSDDYVRLWDGADLEGFSDEGSTQTFDLDAATGNVDMEGTLNVAGATTLQAGLSQALGVESVGAYPTVVTASVAYDASGAQFTVTDGEIWFVEGVYYEVTTNFDCTGDDCTLDLGDGNDADGLVNAADADLQTTFADFTGAPAGWGGLDGSAPRGAYLVGGPMVYAPSGADETIDVTVGGTSPAAGEMTVYVVYRRIQ